MYVPTIPVPLATSTTLQNDYQVGQHLTDKPIAPTSVFLKPDFDYNGFLTISHLPATKLFTTEDGDAAYGLYEEISNGIPNQIFQLLIYERSFLDRPGRFGIIADLLGQGMKWCLQGEGILPTILNILTICNGFNAVIDAGCDQRVVVYATVLSQPTSRGFVERTLWGKLRVNVKFMDTSRDRKVLFLAFQKGVEVMAGLAGNVAPQQPGSGTCPTLLANALSLFGSSGDNPPFNYPNLDSTNDQDEGGDILAQRVVAAHHFAGTAQLGKVVDNRFRITGTEGLYVADASVFPITPPVNAMASTLMIGRLAGVYAVDEMM
jgi:GMC oxidoreductase